MKLHILRHRTIQILFETVKFDVNITKLKMGLTRKFLSSRRLGTQFVSSAAIQAGWEFTSGACAMR
jgi:hypothetical protein